MRRRKTEPVVEDPKRRLLDVCRHRAPACWPCVANDMERQRDAAEAVLREIAKFPPEGDCAPDCDCNASKARRYLRALSGPGGAPRG